MPIYAWASVIVDGRVVATDYAPDAGWLLPSPGAKPGGTYVLESGTHVDAIAISSLDEASPTAGQPKAPPCTTARGTTGSASDS